MHKRIINPVSALVFLTLLTVGAVIPATYAWYSVSTSISVQSSSVLVTTASPDYGEFTLQRLYILQPDYGEVNLNTPSNAVKDVELFPVSTINGIDYYTKVGTKTIKYETGKYTFLAHAHFAEIDRGMNFNFSFNVTVPKCGNVEHPDWLRVHLQMFDSFNLATKTGSGHVGTTDGYILTRDDAQPPNIVQGVGSNGRLTDITSLTAKPLDQSFFIKTSDDYPENQEGDVFFKVTLYFEGSKAGEDQRITNSISMSMFVFPSPKN